MTTIYIYLEDEGTDVWRPVSAEPIGNNLFKIPESTKVPDYETWQFLPGTVVRCTFGKLSGGERLIAVEKV
jgi:hypothetical protein